MNSTRRRRSPTHLPIWAGAFVVLICFAILALSGWREWSSREAELRNAEVDVANLAESLTQHADDTFELIDNVLTGLVYQLGIDGSGPDAIARLQAFIGLRKPSLGRIRGLFIYDETGNWLATSEKVSLKGRNNSDRDYFHHHAQSDDRRTLIGRPVKSRSGGQWIITASRRFNHPDGRFAGVALATVDVAYFAQVFKKFDIGQNGSVALLNTDGIVLARNPDDGSYVGRDLSNTPLFNDRSRYPATAAFHFKSPLDGFSG